MITADWLNAIQRELVNVVLGGGLTINPTDDSQVLKAIRAIQAASIQEAVASLVASSPATLDTLNELAQALGNDPNFATTMTTALSGKANKATTLAGYGITDANTKVETATAIKAALAVAITNVSASKTLVAAELGIVLIDATAGALNLQLPAADATLGTRDVIVRRVDNGGNRLVVQTSGVDKIKFHTHLSATGYPFLVLMGAGDWWHLRSDSTGSWWPIGRCDTTPLGRPVMETTTAFPPGGYGAVSGPVLVRAEWPWLWDHAQQSGMLKTEAQRVGNEGGWTQGDGVSTFRGPEIRGEFLRMLDESRGVDASTISCTATAGSAVLTSVVATTQLAIGMSLVSSPVIPAGATIVSFTANTITMSANATATVAGWTVAVAGRVAGSSEPDALQNITGNLGDILNIQSHGSGAFYTVGSGTAAYPTGNTGNFNQFNFDASRVVRTSTETRSRNIAYPGRIKLI
ncbi:hypothetical protein [Pseudomonas mohnii]